MLGIWTWTLKAFREAGADPNSRGGFYNRTFLMIAVANYQEDDLLDLEFALLLAQPRIEVLRQVSPLRFTFLKDCL